MFKQLAFAVAAAVSSVAAITPTATTSDRIPPGKVTVFDTATGVVSRTVTVTVDPQLMVLSPNGSQLFVANILPGRNSSGTVTAVNTARGTTRLILRGRPAAMAVTPDGKQLYVSVTDGHLSLRNGLGHVDVIRTADDRLVKSIALNGPGLIAMSPEGKTAFVVNSDWVNETNDEMVTPIRTATGTKERAIRVASYKFFPEGIAMSPNGKTLYVLSDKPSPSGSSDPGFLTPIRTATRRVQRAIRVGQGPLDMAMAPDGRTIWLTTGSVGVIPVSTASHTAGHAINVGYCPGCGLVVTPDSKTVYVTANNEVWPISAATDTAGQPFLLTGTDGPIYRPGAIAVSPDGKTLYVIAQGIPTRSVVVIQAATNAIVRLIPAGIDALQIIIAPNGKNGYVLDYGR